VQNSKLRKKVKKCIQNYKRDTQRKEATLKIPGRRYKYNIKNSSTITSLTHGHGGSRIWANFYLFSYKISGQEIKKKIVFSVHLLSNWNIFC
jgi:hypothetical protein